MANQDTGGNAGAAISVAKRAAALLPEIEALGPVDPLFQKYLHFVENTIVAVEATRLGDDVRVTILVSLLQHRNSLQHIKKKNPTPFFIFFIPSPPPPCREYAQLILFSFSLSFLPFFLFFPSFLFFFLFFLKKRHWRTRLITATLIPLVYGWNLVCTAGPACQSLRKQLQSK